MERPIIQIDEERCDGCGQCVLDCAEGALAVIDGKARLISESFCDGLGACLNCPRDALRLVTRDAPDFDEEAALAARAAREGKSAAKGCPGSAARLLPFGAAPGGAEAASSGLRAQTPTWPLQLRLMPPAAPFLRDADILLSAHCAGFTLPGLHADWLRGRVPVIACPKLDNGNNDYLERLTAILRGHADAPPRSLTVLRMSVPCCAGLEHLARAAVKQAGLSIVPQVHVIALG